MIKEKEYFLYRKGRSRIPPEGLGGVIPDTPGIWILPFYNIYRGRPVIPGVSTGLPDLRILLS